MQATRQAVDAIEARWGLTIISLDLIEETHHLERPWKPGPARSMAFTGFIAVDDYLKLRAQDPYRAYEVVDPYPIGQRVVRRLARTLRTHWKHIRCGDDVAPCW